MATTSLEISVESPGKLALTIPFEIEKALGWKPNDEMIIEQPDDKSDWVIVHKRD